jgi:hypothetical protein
MPGLRAGLQWCEGGQIGHIATLLDQTSILNGLGA